MRPRIGLNCDYAHRPSGEKRLALNLNYVEAVEAAGGVPVLLPWQSRTSLRAALEGLDGIVLTGGDDLDPGTYGARPHPAEKPMDPAREAFDLALVREVLRRRLPTLAICLGCQLVNVARGGTLVQDIPSQMPGALPHARLKDGEAPWHRVRVAPGSHLAGILGRASLEANSFHHQSVRTPGRGLEVTARAPDGVVEAVEDPGHPFLLGVQWHPERCYRERPAHRRLFQALIAAAGKKA